MSALYTDEYVCPCCGNTRLIIREVGFRTGRALLGIALPVVGWWMGFTGNKKMELVCPSCKWVSPEKL
jgi:hypothetical protein